MAMLSITVYLRVSTDEQAASGAGLGAQEHACMTTAGRMGASVVATFSDEGISGAAGLEKRPGLLEAIATLEKGDVLMVAKRDRLGRDPLVVAMIEAAVKRKGARIVSAAGEGTESDDPTNILMRRIVDAFAEYERLIIKARTKAALAAKKRRGERTGGVPYGYRLAADGVHLEADPAEQAILATIKALRAEGLSYRALADRLNADGVPARGRQWHFTGVQKLMVAA